MERQVDLSWKGPYTFHEIVRGTVDDPALDDHGVYVWIDALRQCVAYVGKVDRQTIRQRLFREYVEGIGGLSLVPSVDGPGYRWEMSRTNRDVLDTITDLNAFLEVVRVAFTYMANYRIYVAAMPGYAKDVIRDVERHLLCELNPSDTKNRQPPLLNLVIRPELHLWRDNVLPNYPLERTRGG